MKGSQVIIGQAAPFLPENSLEFIPFPLKFLLIDHGKLLLNTRETRSFLDSRAGSISDRRQ
jgi:hypothetical protein